MGKDLYESFPEFAKVIDSSLDWKLGFDLKKVCFEDPDGVINQTEYTQPCMTAFAAGVTDILYAHGIRPSYAAGLSLGEYSALYAAGVFDAETTVRLTAFRGAAMMEAAKGIDCAMTAVLMLGREKLAECCEKASEKGVVQICNYNCPGQLVIGGEKAAVDEAAALAKEAGAKRCLPLKVSGPFHTKLMHPAGNALRDKFKEITFNEMQFPVLFNCLGRELQAEDIPGIPGIPGITGGAAGMIPQLLEKQVQSSVYMEDSIRRLRELGVDTVIEIGPGKALSGFVKKTVGDEIKCYAAETTEDIEKILEALG